MISNVRRFLLYHGRCQLIKQLGQLLHGVPYLEHGHINPNRYKNYRFPKEIISPGVWLYFRFCLSYCDVEELLLTRDIVVTYETIRKWCRKFGQQYAHQLRRQRPRPGDTWHLDEVFLTIHGQRH